MSRDTEYQFVSISTTELEEQLLAAYERITGKTLDPGSPDRIFIAWVAAIVLQERVLLNYVGNQNLPSRAEGENLDALADMFFATSRPGAKPATCTVRFSISEAQASDVIIPAGTRVTDSNKTLIWETLEDATVTAGSTYVDALVQCQTVGALGNGYVAGQINTIVDVYDYYSECANTTESANGCDVATDDEYYAALRESLNAYSTAGASASYAYHAKKAVPSLADIKVFRRSVTVAATLMTLTTGAVNPQRYAFFGGDALNVSTLHVFAHNSETEAEEGTDYSVSYANGLLRIELLEDGSLWQQGLLDITIDRTEAGSVVLYALMDDGSIAPAATKATILAACNDDAVRPLTDSVSIADPGEVDYSIAFTYYIDAAATDLETIQNAVEAAVDEYVKWQSAQFGRDINPSQLIGLLMKTGVKRVELTEPTFATVRAGSDGSEAFCPQVAKLSGTPTIIYGGVENG